MKDCKVCGGSGVYVLEKEHYDKRQPEGNYIDYDFKVCPCLTDRLATAIEAAKLGLSFAPKGPVPEGLDPTFYHTLNYADEVKLQERIDKAREAIAALEEPK